METTKAVVTPNHAIRVAWQDGRAMQLGWLCFLVAAVVTAWMGLTPYLQRAPLPCDEVAYRCLAIQISSAEMDRVITSGISLQPAETWIVTLNLLVAAIFALLVAAFGSQRCKDWFDPAVFRSLARLRGMECRAPHAYAEGFVARKMLLDATTHVMRVR